MRNICYFATVLVFLLFGFVALASGDYLTEFEADIYAESQIAPNVSIQISNYINIGNISIGEESEEIKIYVNNTGNVGIRITPELVNSSEEIFSYLYFRKPYQGNTPIRIGLFSFNISTNSSGLIKTDYFYLNLNLTN